MLIQLYKFILSYKALKAKYDYYRLNLFCLGNGILEISQRERLFRLTKNLGIKISDFEQYLEHAQSSV